MTVWRTLEVHTYPAAALVQVGALQAAGFLCYVDNFFHASIMPNQALALGGYRVVVLDEDWDPIDICSNCNSTDVFRGASLILSALGFLVTAPLPAQTSYRMCRRCGNEWRKPSPH